MNFSTDNPDYYFNPTRDNVNNTNDSLHRAPTSQMMALKSSTIFYLLVTYGFQKKGINFKQHEI